MHARIWLITLLAGGLALLGTRTGPSLSAQSPAGDAALAGIVSSAEEGAMEGVLVSVKRTGSTQTTTVVTDKEGRYRFPRTRLDAGAYAVSIRAIGYDLASEPTVSVPATGAASADLKLKKTSDLSAQLTNAEWLDSFPGTEEQRASVRGCAHCHMLTLPARSRHDATEFTKVVERMAGYPPLSFPLMVQRTPAPRIGGGASNPERQQQAWRRQAEYLTTLNLSSGPQWSYTFKTLPRPKDRATRIIYTEYDLPARTRQPHDVIVDSQGMVWYAAFGEQILGRLDPKTGKTTEWPVPVLKPSAPKGILGMRFDEDENPWLALQFQGGIAKFDKKTEKFQTWRLPPELDGDHVQINQISPMRHKVDGKVWFQDAGTYTVLRLDVASSKIEAFAPYKIPRPHVYDVT